MMEDSDCSNPSASSNHQDKPTGADDVDSNSSTQEEVEELAARWIQRWWLRWKAHRREQKKNDLHVSRMHALTKLNAAASCIQNWWRVTIQEGRYRRRRPTYYYQAGPGLVGNSSKAKSNKKRKVTNFRLRVPQGLQGKTTDGMRMRSAAELVWGHQELVLRKIEEQDIKGTHLPPLVRRKSTTSGRSSSDAHGEKKGKAEPYIPSFADRIADLLQLKPKKVTQNSEEGKKSQSGGFDANPLNDEKPTSKPSMERLFQAAEASSKIFRKRKLLHRSELPQPKDQPYRFHTHPEKITNTRYLSHPPIVRETKAVPKKRKLPPIPTFGQRSSQHFAASGSSATDPTPRSVSSLALFQWNDDPHLHAPFWHASDRPAELPPIPDFTTTGSSPPPVIGGASHQKQRVAKSSSDTSHRQQSKKKGASEASHPNLRFLSKTPFLL